MRLSATISPTDSPQLTISPEGLLSKIAQGAGYSDIDFSGDQESDEFSRQYCGRSPDEAFARAFCSPVMIRFLLDQQLPLRFEIGRKALAFVRNGAMHPTKIESEIALACALREQMLEELFPR